jgi:SAM-dependent methyltransferase
MHRRAERLSRAFLDNDEGIMSSPHPDDSFAHATDEVRAEYERRKSLARAHPGRGTFELRIRHYDTLLAAVRQLPLTGRQILDMGCANGAFLQLMCSRWGAEPHRCVGVDLRADDIARWRASHPDSPITLLCQPAHELDFPDGSFALVHQSMMLSSVTCPALRAELARVMWRLTRPGGFVVSYDFWINPLNPHTVGIRRRELRRLFPAARFAFARTLTVAPPVSRVLARWGVRPIATAERIRVLNTHYLVALAKP